MSRLHLPVSFGKNTDQLLAMIEGSDPSQSYDLLANLKNLGKSESEIVSLLALSSAKWIDHSGPYIGHGILNANPTLRSIELMAGDDADLPLLQMSMYVSELMRHPNYGPYEMQQIEGIEGDSETETAADLSKAIRSGSSRYMAEKLFTGLYSQAGRSTGEYLLYEALMQYGENEHRLLLPYHTIKLLERNNWENAVTCLRPTVQYLSANPDISHGVKAEQLSKTVDFGEIISRGDAFDQENSYDLTRMLLNSVLGNEMIVLADYAKRSTLQDMYEAIALSSTILLLNSGLEQHSVTGKHCILSMIKDRDLPDRIKKIALLSSLEGPRARRIKAYILKSLDAYMKVPDIPETASEEDLLSRLEGEILKGQQENAFKLSGSYVRSGYSTDRLAKALLSICFRTESPFESLHTSKMLVGMRDVTVSSESDMKWIHLAAASRFVAEMVKKEKAASKTAMEYYRKYREIVGTD